MRDEVGSGAMGGVKQKIKEWGHSGYPLELMDRRK